MKKILVMVLLSAFSLPIFAEEVKLTCKGINGDNEPSEFFITYDESKGILSLRGNQQPHVTFSETEIRFSRLGGETYWHINRGTGVANYMQTTGEDGPPWQCSRFRQAF
jgi:hypothetical protein